MGFSVEIELKSVDTKKGASIPYVVTYRVINDTNGNVLASANQTFEMNQQNLRADDDELIESLLDDAIQWAEMKLAGTKLASAVGKKKRLPFRG